MSRSSISSEAEATGVPELQRPDDLLPSCQRPRLGLLGGTLLWQLSAVRGESPNEDHLSSDATSPRSGKTTGSTTSTLGTPSKRTLLSSRAPAFVPRQLSSRGSTEIATSSCRSSTTGENAFPHSLNAQVSSASTDEFLQLPPWIPSVQTQWSKLGNERGSRTVESFDDRIKILETAFSSSTHLQFNTVERNNLHSEQQLERATTTRGRQLGSHTHEFGIWNLPATIPSRTPSPDSRLYYHSGLDSHVDHFPMRDMFIYDQDTSSRCSEKDDFSLDAEKHSGASLKKPASSPRPFAQNRLFELMCTEEEEGQAEKIARDSSKLGRQIISPPSLQMRLVHTSGICKPCAYFYVKDDSCRLGTECSFCHLCPAGALKKYRKYKKALRRGWRGYDRFSRA